MTVLPNFPCLYREFLCILCHFMISFRERVVYKIAQPPIGQFCLCCWVTWPLFILNDVIGLIRSHDLIQMPCSFQLHCLYQMVLFQRKDKNILLIPVRIFSYTKHAGWTKTSFHMNGCFSFCLITYRWANFLKNRTNVLLKDKLLPDFHHGFFQVWGNVDLNYFPTLDGVWVLVCPLNFPWADVIIYWFNGRCWAIIFIILTDIIAKNCGRSYCQFLGQMLLPLYLRW